MPVARAAPAGPTPRIVMGVALAPNEGYPPQQGSATCRGIGWRRSRRSRVAHPRPFLLEDPALGRPWVPVDKCRGGWLPGL